VYGRLATSGGTGLKNLAQVKLENANEIRQRIMSLCLKQCESPDDRILLKIGSYLGDFANNLRSALNYTMRRFVEARLKSVLSHSEYKAIRRHQDFPWSHSKANFDKKDVVRRTRNHCRPVYDFLEGVQPYHQGNEWLRCLMSISNRDKHEIINEIKEPTATAVGFMNPDGTPHLGPDFFGPGSDRILVKSGPEPHVHVCPCYYYPYGGFAIKGGKWAFFLISIDQRRLGLTRFIERVPRNVKNLIDDFDGLI
jgi:hypothetical protein